MEFDIHVLLVSNHDDLLQHIVKEVISWPAFFNVMCASTAMLCTQLEGKRKTHLNGSDIITTF